MRRAREKLDELPHLEKVTALALVLGFGNTRAECERAIVPLLRHPRLAGVRSLMKSPEAPTELRRLELGRDKFSAASVVALSRWPAMRRVGFLSFQYLDPKARKAIVESPLVRCEVWSGDLTCVQKPLLSRVSWPG